MSTATRSGLTPTRSADPTASSPPPPTTRRPTCTASRSAWLRDGDQQAIAAGLAANVTAQGNHLATGANGSKYILPMLTDYGYGDLAYLVATNPTAPGWGQWFLQCGATTMWEAWEDTSCNSARSRDHAFMGTVDDWLFSNVSPGSQSTSPGFRTVAIDPSPVAGPDLRVGLRDHARWAG